MTWPWTLARRAGSPSAGGMNGDEHPRWRSWLYAPLDTAFVMGLATAGLLIIGLVAFDALSYVYHRIGISLGWMAIILAGALLGSMINIPVARLRAQVRQENTLVTVFGVTYRIPLAIRTGSTTIAVNVGGAIVPAAVAIYLICHDRLPLTALFATLIVTALVFSVARPVAGVGIVTPPLVPPLVAALAAIWLGGHFVAAVAYVAGTFGTLVGADLLNMPRVRSLQAPMVSIGGAGTFDGLFLTGLVAVLLASL
jgi:uncharacterized membrane protein